MRGQSTERAAHQRDVPGEDRRSGGDVDLELVRGEIERVAAGARSGSAEARCRGTSATPSAAPAKTSEPADSPPNPTA